uniref:CCHC-type domain-containing protein n=2 Tax=Fagus sylvatica TaxID=28930 RepID=A0A2N9IKH6_FAGSY
MVSEPMASSLQSPLMLLSSMSNLMPVKLDSTNFIVWKHQLSSILRAYSMINFVDGTVQSPSRFLVDAEGNSTTTVNPEFQSWDIRDQALLTLINSTLSPSVLPMVVGQDTAQSVWKTLEHRFTSTSRSNVLNLKIELHNLKKGSESTEEQSLAESFDSGKDLNSMAMFASAAPNNRNTQSSFYVHNYQNRGRGRNNNHRGRGRFNSNNHSNASTQGNTQFSNNQYPSSNAFTQGNAQFSQNFQGKSENSRPLCQICGKLGHQALDCYHRMDFAYQGRHPPERLAAMASTSNSSQIQAGETWLTDTGATDHLTSNLDNLTGHTPYQGHDQVAVGNGQAIPIKKCWHWPYTTHKLQPRTTPCLFLGYPTYSKGYICLDPHTHRVYISRHVLFNVSEFLAHLSLPSQSSPSPVNSSFDSTSWLAILAHSCTPPLIPDSTPSPAASVPLSPADPPPSKFPQWCAAMHEEYSALQRQHTWTLVPPPCGKNIVGCKWVFKLKRNSDGTISRHKARLVAKGFHQQHGIDFAETFSPVVKPPTVRLILALAVTYNWPLRQLDVSNAFLHGILKEEVYMAQPPGYVSLAHPNHVCHLHKSIYGLKQAPRAWFESFTSQLVTLGFHSSTTDSSLFIYRNGSTVAFLLLYVDDIVLTDNNALFLSQLITNLRKVFELKDLGTLSFFLGLQIQRSSTGLTLTQTKYATDLLHKHHMQNCSPCKTPCVPHVRLSATEGTPLTDVHAYRSLVGALHYLTFTRPDLSFAVHQVCQFMNAPTSIHLTAAKRILRYLQGTLDHGLHYTPGPTTLSAFTDADWAGDPNDRRSTSGLLVFLGHNPITWSAKKQLTVSRSSTEAEYRALASAFAEVCWLRVLLRDLSIFISAPPILWCDNVSALAIASNPVFHARTKHIEVDFHFIRERVLRKDLQVQFVSTADQLADIFTKGLSSPRFRELQSKLMVPVATICLREDDEANGKSCSANSCTKRQ